MKLKQSGVRTFSKYNVGVVRLSVTYTPRDSIHVEGRIVDDQCVFRTWRYGDAGLCNLPLNWIMV